jgi:rare lipoprotein A (peptidoglycan hydrolase)
METNIAGFLSMYILRSHLINPELLKNFIMRTVKFFAAAILGLCVLLLSSCASSRPDLVWSEDGRQFGKASWYDDHGDRTANGELYNMHALTAAHPSVALNSLVEVTNLGNGKSVTVRVNDRLPPIHEGRVIDLSKAAFAKLANHNVGLIEVEVRVIRYGNNKYVKVDRSAPSGKIYLATSNPSRKSSK